MLNGAEKNKLDTDKRVGTASCAVATVQCAGTSLRDRRRTTRVLEVIPSCCDLPYLTFERRKFS